MDPVPRYVAWPGVQKVLEIHVPPDIDKVPVVDPGSADAVLVDPEAQGPDEVKGR
jgi:hypothetical protein